jgi:hypothetical protein
MDFVVSLPGCGQVQPTSEAGTPKRRSYVVPMMWFVLYEYELPGGTDNILLKDTIVTQLLTKLPEFLYLLLHFHECFRSSEEAFRLKIKGQSTENS